MMNFMMVLFQQTGYENWGIKSILIAAIVGLSSVVVFLYKSKDKALAEKDEKIMAVIENHQKDLKEANNDMKVFVEKYHQFTQHLKEVVNARGLSK